MLNEICIRLWGTEKGMNKEIKRQIAIICSLLMYFTYVVLIMMRTKVLITGYGSEVNAVFQTSSQIFAYLILFESGMSAAYQFKLYEPVSHKNVKKTAGLFAGLKSSMKKIAFKMTVALFVVSVIYPFIMDRISLSYIKAGVILFLLGIRFVIPYFVSIASKTLLNVYDYKYIVDVIDSLGNIVITIMELFAMLLFHWSVYGVLLIGCMGNIMIGIIYAWRVKKICGGIQKEAATPDYEPEGMTKDILFHQITGLFNSNIDTIILSIANIMLVTPYHAYYSIMNYFTQIVNKISENYRTKTGMKIKRQNQDLYIYFQVMMAFHMIAAIIAVSMFVLNINNFIFLWIGKEYILSNSCIILLALYLVLRTTINCIFLMRDGAGLYRESKWFSFREGIVNLILSIALACVWGIEGILFATVFATYTMLLPGNAKLVYKKVLGRKNTLWIDYFIIITVSILLIFGFKCSINVVEGISWKDFLIRLLKQGSICGVFATLSIVIIKWQYMSQLFFKKCK